MTFYSFCIKIRDLMGARSFFGHDMEKEHAKKIIDNNNLIPGGLGRRILYAIENNLPIKSKDLPKNISLAEIEKIKFLYFQKLNSLKQQKIFPRNLVFYHLVKDKFPNFSWDIKQQNIKINAPRVKNLRPSLISLLLDRVDPENDTNLHRKYSSVNKLPKKVVNVISSLMDSLQVIYPEEEKMGRIVKWLLAGLRNETVTIFSPICPDYSVVPTGDPECPYRHTFNELGSGLGLIAKRILSALPIILNELKKINIKPKIVIGIGDFEAYSLSNLERLKLSQDEFLARIIQSKNEFEHTSLVPVKVEMLAKLLGGKTVWLKTLDKFMNSLQEGNFGSSELSNKKILDIVRKRKNLYDRWYGKKSLLNHIPHLLNQGAEYAAMGLIISRFPNCMVLGADNDAMGDFYSLVKPYPMLYLKRFYC